VMPEIEGVIEAHRRALLRQDADLLKTMADRWIAVERDMRDSYEMLAREVKDSGVTKNQAWKLNRMERYQTLIEQVQSQVQRYSQSLVPELMNRQTQYIQLGLSNAEEYFNIAGMRQFNRLPVEAVNMAIGYAADGSPLQRLLAASYEDAVDGITQKLVNGIASGDPVRSIAKGMANGASRSLNRMMTIARTETLRAYRTSTHQQYKDAGVERWQRVEARDRRTCQGCLALDGKKYPAEDRPFDHPRGRMTLVPVLDGLPERTSAEKWFRSLPEERQKQQIGEPRWKGLQRGAIAWEDMAKVTDDPTWGKSVGVRSLKELGLKNRRSSAHYGRMS